MNPRWGDLSENWGKRFVLSGQSMKEADLEEARRFKALGSSLKSRADGV
jgi:hypothetical protein